VLSHDDAGQTAERCHEDAESKAFVDGAVPAIVATWDQQQLLDRATPELRRSIIPDNLASLFKASLGWVRLSIMRGRQAKPTCRTSAERAPGFMHRTWREPDSKMVALFSALDCSNARDIGRLTAFTWIPAPTLGKARDTPLWGACPLTRHRDLCAAASAAASVPCCVRSMPG
jgi:hypothetical protein